jgi:hypothetical protein
MLDRSEELASLMLEEGLVRTGVADRTSRSEVGARRVTASKPSAGGGGTEGVPFASFIVGRRNLIRVVIYTASYAANPVVRSRSGYDVDGSQ